MSQVAELFFFFFSSRRRHTRCSRDWSSDVCSSDLESPRVPRRGALRPARRLHVLARGRNAVARVPRPGSRRGGDRARGDCPGPPRQRSEEHTSELQSRLHLVCRLLLEKKKKKEANTKIENQGVNVP